MAPLRQLFSYSTAVGLATQSGRFHNAMNKHLVQLAAHTERATSLHADSGTDTALAAEHEEQAGVLTEEAAKIQEESTTLRTKAEKDRAEATAAAERGAELEEEAAAMKAKAEQDETLAETDAETSEALHVKAGTEHAAALEDGAAANADDAEAIELSTAAKEEHASAAAAAEEAATEEAIFDTEEAAAVAEAEAAAEAEEMEEADVAAVAGCEFIPLLDVVCDVVGGVAGVGFHAAAVAEAAESVADFAAAAAAKAEEDAALAEAEEWNAKAVADDEAAAALKEKAEGERVKAEAEEEAAGEDEAEAESKLAMSEEEQARAEVEEAQAEELEAEAKEAEEEAAEKEAQATEEEAEATEEETVVEEKSAQAEKEEVQAKEEEGKAEAEEAEGDEEWEQSIKHGLAAFWNAALSAIVSLSAMLFFGAKILFRMVPPGIVHLRAVHQSIITSGVSETGRNVVLAPAARHLSYGTLHVCSLAASVLPFAGHLAHFGSYTPKARGGLIILIACVAAFVQSFILHLLPHVHTKTKEHLDQQNESCGQNDSSGRTRMNVTPVVLRILLSGCKIFLQNFVYLAPLVTIELLILWINFARHHNNKSGPSDHSEIKQVVMSCLLWAIFLAGAGFHIWYYELRYMKNTNKDKDQKEEEEEEEEVDFDEEDFFVCKKEEVYQEKNESELVSLLSEEKKSYQYSEKQSIVYNREMTCEQKSKNDTSCTVASSKEKAEVHPVTQYFYDLQLPFEILVISCMIALIGSCFPNVQKLHHTFKSIGGFSIPKITIPVIWCACAVSGMCILMSCISRRQPTPRRLQ